MDEKSVRKMDRSAVLNEMTDMLKLQYNMDYLERIFDKCGEDSLLDKSRKITSGNIFQLKTFQATVAPGKLYLLFAIIQIIGNLYPSKKMIS